MLSEKIDVLQLTFYTAPVSCLMLFPFYLYREVCCYLGNYNTQPTASKWTIRIFPVTPCTCFRTTAVQQCVYCWQTSILMAPCCVQHANFMIYLETNQRGVAIIIIFSSFVALAYNVTHNYLLQRTSAVTVTVLGEVKIVGLLLLSAMLLPGEPIIPA